MYECKLAQLSEILPHSGEKSMGALRSRAGEGVLVFVRNNGATQYYDFDLSVIRCRARTVCRTPGITGSRIAGVIKAESAAINGLIVERLNAGVGQDDVVEAVSEVIRSRL